PKITGCFAPVAEGTFDGRRFHVWYASKAKAAASFAAEGKPNSSENRSESPKGDSSLASIASNVGLLAPPPDTISSRYPVPRFITNLRIASVIVRAVSAVAVATTSAFADRRQRCKKSRTKSRPNSSRPAVFGGGLRKKDCRKIFSTTSGITLPVA